MKRRRNDIERRCDDIDGAGAIDCVPSTRSEAIAEKGLSELVGIQPGSLVGIMEHDEHDEVEQPLTDEVIEHDELVSKMPRRVGWFFSTPHSTDVSVFNIFFWESAGEYDLQDDAYTFCPAGASR